MKVRGGEFSTGTMGNFQPELTFVPRGSRTTAHAALGVIVGGAEIVAIKYIEAACHGRTPNWVRTSFGLASRQHAGNVLVGPDSSIGDNRRVNQ